MSQATSSQPPTASADIEAPTVKQTRFEITEQHILPTISGRRTAPAITTSSDMEQQLSDSLKETTPGATGKKAATPSVPNTPVLLGDEFRLPFSNKLMNASTHSSLLVDDSGAQSRFAPSRATSRRASILQPAAPHLSREASSVADTNNEDATSAWRVEDDASVLSKRKERGARSQRAASTTAQSDIMEEEEDADLLERYSDLDPEDRALYDVESEYGESQSDHASRHSGENPAGRAIAKPKDAFAQSLDTKSPDDIAQLASQPRNSLLSASLKSPEVRKIHDLIASYRERNEREQATIGAKAAEAQKQQENEAVIKLCNNNTQSELQREQGRQFEKFGRKERSLQQIRHNIAGAFISSDPKVQDLVSVIGDNLGYNDQQRQGLMHAIANNFAQSDHQLQAFIHSIAPDYSEQLEGLLPSIRIPKILARRQQLLTEERIKVTTELEQLSTPGLIKKNPNDPNQNHYKQQLAALKERQALLKKQQEQIITMEADTEEAKEKYESTTIEMEHIRLEMHRHDQAIALKRQRAIISSIDNCEDQQDKRLALSHELAKNYDTPELERMLSAYKQKKGTEKALTILDKAISFQKMK